jgi:hypothetical protein
MKKKVSLWIAGLFSILMTKLVSAASPDYYIEMVIGWIKDSYRPIFEVLLGTSAADEFFFAKILVFLLIFSIVYMVTQNIDIFSKNMAIIWIVSLGVSILATRYIPNTEFFKAMLLPYSVLGVAVTIFLPMLIYFFFVNTSVPGMFGRRFAWFLYGAIFLVLWGMRGSELGDANWIYILGLIFVILNFIFDGPIHQYFGTVSLAKGLRNYHVNAKAETAAKLQALEENKDYYSESEFRKEKKRLEHKLQYHARNS